MNKTLGIGITYWRNVIQCEEHFKKLMNKIKEQISKLEDDVIVYIYEDGQISDWLKEYLSENIIIEGDITNRGVSYGRNKCLDYLIDKVDYILYLDSDDNIDDDYLEVMVNSCCKGNNTIIESRFYVNDQLVKFNPKLVRCGVAGSAISTELIGDVRFDETIQIGEDTKFMREIYKPKIYKKYYAPTSYYYQYGINEYSLSMNYANKRITKERG